MARQLEMQMTDLPVHVVRDVKQFVPGSAFEKLPFWKKLDETERRIVKSEGSELAGAMMLGGISDLAKGEHLLRLHAVLEPKRCFQKFVVRFCRMAPKQAYRYIRSYETARDKLTEPVLKAAMARNMRLLGVANPEKMPLGLYTGAFRALGPPTKSADPDMANKYLDQLEQTRKEQLQRQKKRSRKTEEPSGDPEEMLKRAYRTVSACFKRLPHNSRSRQAWLEKLFGYVLAEAGVSSQMSFAPSAAPEGFRAVVGRPRLLAEEGATA